MMRRLRGYGCSSSSRETSPTPPDAASGSFPNYGGDRGDDDGEDIKTAMTMMMMMIPRMMSHRLVGVLEPYGGECYLHPLFPTLMSESMIIWRVS